MVPAALWVPVSDEADLVGGNHNLRGRSGSNASDDE
jgi:hypothetical protein